MKIALLSTFDLDGGAAKAAHRLHIALRGVGIDSRMFVQIRTGQTEGVFGPSGGLEKLWGRLRPWMDAAPGIVLGYPFGAFSVNWLPSALAKSLREFDPDVVHLHWISAGGMGIYQIGQIDRPLVWTAHDMWPFTGGCHYDRGCGRFTMTCAPCPMQTKLPQLPLARHRQEAKARLASLMNYITPSQWMADKVRESMVGAACPISVIPNGLDLKKFHPIDRAVAKDLFGLSTDRIILLFGAVNARSDTRKGYAHLEGLLQRIAQTNLRDRIELCIYGGGAPGRGEMFGIPVSSVGTLADEESLIALYSAADIFVAPSLQDNLPNTVLEATACGLPSLAFRLGGMPDLIEHQVTGYLVDKVEGSALYEGLARMIAEPEWLRHASRAARALAVRKFSSDALVDAHLRVYQGLVTARCRDVSAHRDGRKDPRAEVE